MNVGAMFKAFDTIVALRDVAKRFKGAPPSETGLTPTPPGGGLGGQIEARLTNVVVAALKEAFDRDHARLELERNQLDEQRRRAEEEQRRAEEAMRLELRRQAADRELGRLRLLAGTALVGWIASVALLVARLESATPISRGVLAVGWLLLLGALGASFSAQRRIGHQVADETHPIDAGPGGVATLWLLIGGLGVAATSLLF
jgi:hypothetical protein